MKKILFFLIFSICLFHCSAQLSNVKNGDLLFVGLPLDYSLFKDTTLKEVKASTSAVSKKEINYIHVAILEVDAHGDIWIIDATLKHGVDRHPLDTFLADFTLKDGSHPILDVKRLKNGKDADLFVANAKQFCGRGYDLYFLPDNAEKYCSELVRDSYVTADDVYLFSISPMDFKSSDGTYPPYWTKMFNRLGQPIPQGLMGTTPNAMVKDKALKKGKFPLL